MPRTDPTLLRVIDFISFYLVGTDWFVFFSLCRNVRALFSFFLSFFSSRRKASLQLSQVLDRLEEDEQRQKGVLEQRIDAERVELKTTMSFSRAAAVASVEQEVRRPVGMCAAATITCLFGGIFSPLTDSHQGTPPRHTKVSITRHRCR